MSMVCAVCGKGPMHGVSIFRMNETGGPALWACNEHKDQFDGHVPDEVMDIVRTIEGKEPGR